MDNDDNAESIHQASRNDSLGFAQRTLRNLEYIEESRQTGADVHVVTQRILSLLGLVAFPWHAGLSEHIKTQRLDALAQKGWPEWTISLGNTETLGDLVYHLRNAIAHRRVRFSSDDRKGREVEVAFEDARKENLPVYWRAQINGDDLLDFCRKFARLVDDAIG
jgi:hypothetical protein